MHKEKLGSIVWVHAVLNNKNGYPWNHTEIEK